MKRKLLLCVVALASVFALMSCTKEEKKLQGEFNLVEMIFNGESQNLIPADLIVTNIEGNKYSFAGNSGVNQYNGEVSISKDSFKASENFLSTKMAASEEEMNFEVMYLNVLLNADKLETFQKDGKECVKIYSSASTDYLLFESK